PRRPQGQQGHAPAGGHPAVRDRPEPGGHPRQGHLPQRPDGTDPVRSADGTGPLGTDAGQPAMDQQVLHHGPRPGRSFVEWAVLHEHTVFAISYRNPDPSMSGVTLDDYLVDGPRAAVDVITDITGAEKVGIVGLCLGGAITGMLAAYLAGTGDQRLGSVTLLNTLLDYSEPGVLGAFTDELTVSRLERRMQERGVLDGGQMAATFNALRPNDLI